MALWVGARSLETGQQSAVKNGDVRGSVSYFTKLSDKNLDFRSIATGNFFSSFRVVAFALLEIIDVFNATEAFFFMVLLTFCCVKVLKKNRKRLVSKWILTPCQPHGTSQDGY